jgi:tRNA(Ile2) C34 agmatinyltransferase TiaS
MRTNPMFASPVTSVISICGTLGLAYLALRRLWSSQHALDPKASVVRWGAGRQGYRTACKSHARSIYRCGDIGRRIAAVIEDVDKSAYHHLSHTEIAGDNPLWLLKKSS